MFDIGVDIENIKRFEKYDLEKDLDFLKTIFSKEELDYCFSSSKPAKHLAARFCAKEAFIKASGKFGVDYSKIKILNDKNGKPFFELPEELKSLESRISLSHDKDKAIAFVILEHKI